MPEMNWGELMWWAWIAMALLFFIAEIFTAGFVLACFGVGAAVAAVVAFIGFPLGWQLAAFIVATGLAVMLSRTFADRVTAVQPTQRVGIDRVLGKHAVVLDTIDPMKGSGLVRVDDEEWRAESIDTRVIPAGASVEVMAVEGTRLRVRLLQKAAGEGTANQGPGQ